MSTVLVPFLGVHVPQGVAFDPTTSYANAGGTGDRRKRFGYSFTSGLFASDNPAQLINGTQADVAWFAGVSVSAHNIRWDLGYQHVVDEFKWYQSGVGAQGTWKMQASNDDSTYVDIGAAFTLGSSATTTYSLGGSTPYRYWKLQGVSGTGNAGPYVREIEFKISAAADSPAATAYVTGNRTGSITITKSSGIALSGGALTDWIDGSNSTKWFTTSTACTGEWLQFDFGSAKVVDGVCWRWDANGTWGTSTWKWQGSNDASSWTDLGPAHPMAATGASFSTGSGIFDTTDLAMAANRNSYRYYRMLGASGNMNSSGLIEIEFRST